MLTDSTNVFKKDILNLCLKELAKEYRKLVGKGEHRSQMRTRTGRAYPETSARLRTEIGSAGRLFCFS